jgi:hypothetical protein
VCIHELAQLVYKGFSWRWIWQCYSRKRNLIQKQKKIVFSFNCTVEFLLMCTEYSFASNLPNQRLRNQKTETKRLYRTKKSKRYIHKVYIKAALINLRIFDHRRTPNRQLGALCAAIKSYPRSVLVRSNSGGVKLIYRPYSY